MKKSIQQFALSCFFIMLISGTAFSANEYFRSVATGNWNANATWQMSTNSGGTWFAATSTPTDTSGVITVQSPNTVTVTVSVNADQLTVNNGAVLSINAAIILTIKDGSGTDLYLASGGIISGSGTLQTQGADVYLDIRGNGFNTAFKANTGNVRVNDATVASAYFNGTMTIDAGVTFAVAAGGYIVTAKNNVINNGIITSTGGYFIMRGASLTNNDTIRGSNVYFDSITSLSGTGAYTANNISVRSTGNVSLANNLTFSPTTSFSVSTGGVFNPNTRTFTMNTGTFYAVSGSTISNSGIFQTQGTVSMIIKSGSNFNAPFKVNTGTTTSNDDGSPYIADYKGTLTVDAGAILTTTGGGYSNRALGNATINGTVSGNNFIVRGPSLINNGVINSSNLQFDSTTLVTSTGVFSSNTIVISATGKPTLSSNVTFSPVSSFTINNGGVFDPGSKTFTFNSGNFIINTGGVVAGFGPNAGILQTQNNVNFIFRNGSTFNSAVKVNTGTLTAYNDQSPYIGIYYGTITVDAGAVFSTPAGGYTAQIKNSVTNNGTITTGGGAGFSMKGPSFINNSSVTCQNISFDSTTSVSGFGTYTGSSITIGSTGNVSLGNNITFSPSSIFNVNSGGILNPNTRTLNINSGTFAVNGGGTVTGAGLIQTQGTVSVVVRNNSTFNSAFKVNTGTAFCYNDQSPYYSNFNGPVTVDAGATLNSNSGGYTFQANNTVTNNGTITGGSTFRMKGPSFVNNSTINTTYINFDTTTNVSGAGSNSGFFMSAGSSGNIILASNVTFTPGNNFTLSGGAVINPNSFIFTAIGNFYFNNGSTVTSSGTFRTQGSTALYCKAGSNFNGTLKVNTGITYSNDDSPPYIGTIKGTVTIDTGAVLSTIGGGYTLRLTNNVVNNGTLTHGGGASLRFAGANLTNNGVVSAPTFYFDTSAHSLQGTGSWTANANVVSGSTVNLASNHKMFSVTVNSGGTFNVLSYMLSLSASNPIGNSGTFNTSAGKIEYNGTSAQSISSSNITYNKLRINNNSGTSLNGSTTVNDTLSVVLGDLNLNGQILTISPSGYLTETAGNTINGSSGYVTTTRSLNAPSSLNVGGLGAVLTTAVNLGSTEIRRGHAVQNGLNGSTSILRYYDITPAVNSGLNATMVYNFDESELNGKVESALSLFKSTNTGSTWTVQGGTVNTVANNITLTGIAGFSRWSAGAPTAVASTLKLVLEGFYNTSTGRLNMRDTVRAYLRNSITPFAVVDSAKSVIDSVTFNGTFLFANAPTGTYYIQTKHRNALETWSKSGGESYTLGSSFSYDFTTDSAKAYQNNMKKTGTKWAFFEGDVNQEGSVDVSDVILIYNNSALFINGYVNTDVNGDRLTDISDVIIAYNNSVNFVNKKAP